MIPVKFMKLHPDAQIPTRGTAEAAGLDLYALEECFIPACHAPLEYHDVAYINVGQAAVSTGIACQIPVGYFGKVEARSGLSFKHGIETGAGVVDADYRHEVRVKIYNFTDKAYVVQKGDRIAQMVIQPYLVCDPVEGDIDSDTERGSNGFGSTGR